MARHLVPLTVLLACCVAWRAAAQEPQSCTGELEAIRDRLRPLVAEARGLAATCGARQDYLSRIGQLDAQVAALTGELDRARRDADAEAGRLRAEADGLRREAASLQVDLRQQGAELGRLVAGIGAVLESALRTARRSTCDELRPPRFAGDAFVISGRVADVRPLRDAAARVQAMLGVPLRLDGVEELPCVLTVVPGLSGEPAERGLRVSRAADIRTEQRDRLPRTGDCESIWAEVERRPVSARPAGLSSFWVWGRGDELPGDSLWVCEEGRLRVPQADSLHVLLLRDR